jgi:drug/metabolite transporter (DMT)-like permease
VGSNPISSTHVTRGSRLRWTRAPGSIVLVDSSRGTVVRLSGVGQLHSGLAMRPAGILRMTALAGLWGSNFLWIKVALEAFSPVQVTLLRLAMGALILLPIVRAQRLSVPRQPIVWVHLFGAALTANALPYWLFAYGEQHIASNLAGAVNATTPLWTVLFVLLMRAEQPPTLARLGGLATGFIGALILIQPWSADAGGSLLGGLACLVASASYGVSFAYMARYLTPLQIPTLVLAFGQLVAATPFAGRQPIRLAVTPTLSLLVLGIAGTGLAYILNYRILVDDGPSAASTVNYLLPAVSIALGVAFLDEPASWHLLTGTTIVLAGVSAVRHFTARTPEDPADPA